MRAAQAFSIIALVGSALAAPWENWNGPAEGKEINNKPDDAGKPVNNHYNNNKDQDAVVIVTKTVTVKGQKPADATPAPQAAQNWSPVAQQTWSEAKPAPTGAAPIENDGSWQSVVAEWRSKMELGSMSPDSKLVANALKTAQDGNGDMVHQLNPGTMGQVLAPGQPDEFVKVFVGGWLCEMPDARGMDGICNTMSAGWAYGGETGHAEILRGSYKNIGCACATGIWACDVS